MRLLKIIVFSLAVTGFVVACKPVETVKEQPEAPSYETGQEQEAPSYGEVQKEDAPSYGQKRSESDAPSHTAGASGDVVRGKTLFTDITLGGGTAGISCNSCHPDGNGLEISGEKNRFNIMGNIQNSIEEAVNFCVEASLKGRAIDPEGRDMTDIVTYIKSLKGG